MFCFEFFYCNRITKIDLLQGFQRGKFIIVLQDVLGTQVFTKQFYEVFLLFFTFNIGRVREPLFQF
ncbi:hypothetical protein PU71_13525 [Escherichia coli]|nr:hypothetical protein PU73_00770 [Escherichia coli]KHH02913.1 hypothetical protein PU71_13525 [Escherichia coli]